jgi:RimJ/RimL family protein N-acetyltransferase
MKALQKFMTPNGECVVWQATSENDGLQFWQIMGKWFANKEVADTLGEPIYDHDDLVWTLAIIKDSVVGFGAIDLSHADKKTALLNYGFMAKECRGTGIYRRLLEARVKILEEDTQIETIKALCTEASKPVLEKLGFKEKSKRGRYTWFVKEVKRK